jgi:NAD(P)-dependent dehydrogenase (short-subunit alcohol dehydrogenase family)
MRIKGCTALVTGANRGLGLSFVEALFAAGAAKVYAGARDPSMILNTRAIPLALDIMDNAQVAAAATECDDVSLLINNAGVLLNSPMLAEGSADAMATRVRRQCLRDFKYGARLCAHPGD